MKKSLVLALVVSFVLSVAGTAFAFPVDFSGSFKYEFRQNKDFGTPSYTENRFYTDLNFGGKIDDSTSYFARFAGQVKDRQSAGAPNVTNGFTMDKFGVKTNTGDWTWALGRQGVTLGQGGILYSGNDIDPLNYFDGVVATTKAGDFNLKFVGGKVVANTEGLNDLGASTTQDWVGFDVTVPVDKVTLGGGYVQKTATANGTDAKYWGLNAATKLGVVDFSAEYVKSNANSKSAASTMAGTYAWDQDSFTLAYNNVQANAVDDYSSNIGAIYYPNGNGFSGVGYKGFTYAYHHSFTKAMGFNAYLLSLQPLTGADQNHKNTELGLNVKWSF